MAQLSDVPVVLRRVGVWKFAVRVWKEIGADNHLAWAAAISYAWLFAFFPFMIFLLSLLPYLPDETRKEAEGEIMVFLFENLPRDSAEVVADQIKRLGKTERKGLLTFGLIFMIWGASGGMNMTITALERCYEIDRGRPFYKKRPVAIGLTVAVAILVVCLIVLLPVGTVALRWVERQTEYGLSPVLRAWKLLRFPLALLLMFNILNILYYYGPSIKQRFVFATPGAVFAIVVWWILAFAFRFYVDRWGRYNETYGAVGGVLILLLFFYIDAMVLLIGAEINSEIDFEVLGVERGSRDFTRMVKGAEGGVS